MVKVPSCVLWQLTKKNSRFIVQQKGAKARGDQFSCDPLNATGFHNASAQGYTTEGAVGIAASLVKSKPSKKKGKKSSGTGFRKVFTVSVTHKQTHAAKAISKGTSTVGSSVNTSVCKRSAGRVAKVIQGIPTLNEKRKALLLRRLGKLTKALTDKKQAE